MIYYGSVNIKQLRLQVHSILFWGMPFSSLVFPAAASDPSAGLAQQLVGSPQSKA